MGANKHFLIHQFIFEQGANVLEIGTEEYFGRSTTFLAEYALEHRFNFWTVDPDEERIKRSRQLPGCKAVCAKGEDFLINFGQPIHFAYLDSLDWAGGRLEQNEDNRLSAEIHLLQTRRLLQWMDIGVVVFDDTWIAQKFGKGILAYPFLLKSGFQVAQAGPGWLAMARGKKLKQ